MVIKTKQSFRSSRDMLDWQYKSLLAEMQQLQLHAEDPTCPCSLRDMGEFCLAKHSLNVASLASETATMDDKNAEMLFDLAEDATEMHKKLREHVCGHGDDVDVVTWSRQWRKKLEPIYYSCKVKATLHEVAILHDIPYKYYFKSDEWYKELAKGRFKVISVHKWFAEAKTAYAELKGRGYHPTLHYVVNTWNRYYVSVSLPEVKKLIDEGITKIEGNSLSEGVTVENFACKTKLTESLTADDVARLFAPPPTLTKEVDRLRSLASELSTACPECRTAPSIARDIRKRADALSIIELPVLAKVVALPSPAAVTNKTFATGITGLTRYEFEYRIVDALSLLVSHDPMTFTPNPRYPQELQPRLRERAATRLQVQNIAANLEPDALLTDYRSIDRGAPIIGPDRVVESGNGRVMALILAAKEHPAVYASYRDKLKEVAPTYALDPKDVDKYRVPILVRERLTKVDRRHFVEESNASTTIESSAVEKARSDAGKITLPMLDGLEVLEGEAIEDALRSTRNKDFVTSFLRKLSENEQARLVDAKGILNQDGVRRVAMALFVATFKGDVGLKLAERFFESTDVNVRNALNGIGRSLGLLARAESLTAGGQRDSSLAIGEDLAKAVSVFSAIKKTPGMDVKKYLAQLQMLERELTPFQERILAVLDEHSKSARRIGSILGTYAQLVLDSPPPQQASMIEAVRASKQELFETAVRRATMLPEAVTAEDVAKMFEAHLCRAMTKAEWERALKYQMPFDFEKVPPKIEVTPPCPPVCPTVSVMPPPMPKGKTKYELFPFQQEGVEWLKGRSFALLADEMGLGKTPQAIHWGADNRPVLVVVPSALTLNWQREITAMWRPQDKAVLLDGKTDLPHKLPDWCIMSYGMLNHYLPQLRRAGFKAIIIDEAHLVKNLDTQRTKNILALVVPDEPKASDKPIPNRLAVTGTPVVNRPIELFSLLVFLGVKKRVDFREFLERYTQHKYVKGRLVFTGARNLYELHQNLKPIMLRRMKKDVLKQLPPKINTPMFVAITNAAEYVQAERNFLTWLAEQKGTEAAIQASKAEIIVKMNALRMLAANGKVGPVCDWLKPCRDGQGKVLVFCSFIEPLNGLKRCKPEAVLYTGALSSPERQTMVDHFQHSTGVCYFLGTVGAAGVGITLTAANRVTFLDLPWTPGAKIQAEDRAHRIGQTQTVEVVNVLAKNTIDERMLELLKEKEFIIAQAIDGKTRDEAATTSVANALIESFLRVPMGEPLQYESDMAEPEPEAISDDDLTVLEGFREEVGKAEVVEMFDYSWLAKKVDACNVSVRDVDAALSWRPLRNIVAAAIGVKAKVQLCSIGFVYGRYQLIIDGLSIDAEDKIAKVVMKTTRIKQVHTAVPSQRVYEVVLPIGGEPSELTWTPQEVVRQVRHEPTEQLAMFAEAIMAERIPKAIDVYSNVIHRHYRDAGDMQDGTIRTLKPAKGVLVYIGCPVGAKWNAKTKRCSPRAEIVKSVVPRTDRYEQELQALRRSHPNINVKFHTAEGVEAREPELQEVKDAMKTAEVVE